MDDWLDGGVSLSKALNPHQPSSYSLNALSPFLLIQTCLLVPILQHFSLESVTLKSLHTILTIEFRNMRVLTIHANYQINV